MLANHEIEMTHFVTTVTECFQITKYSRIIQCARITKCSESTKYCRHKILNCRHEMLSSYEMVSSHEILVSRNALESRNNLKLPNSPCNNVKHFQYRGRDKNSDANLWSCKCVRQLHTNSCFSIMDNYIFLVYFHIC